MINSSISFITITITISLGIVYGTCTWNYEDTTKWDEAGVLDVGETNYCGTSYTQQSPINIDTTASCSDDQQTLDWSINEEISNFKVTNTGHSIQITPIGGDSDDESNDSDDDDESNDLFGKLVNKFQTTSGEHSEYCLDSFHIHWGQNTQTGSEHLVNDNQYAMEMHFIHHSCDYADITSAFNANPTDPYVLAVVGVLFTAGAENEFIKQITDNVLSLRDYGSEISISGVSMTSLTSTEGDDDESNDDESNEDGRSYYQYKGSLTTPPCSPIVSWHVLEEPMTISEAQLDALRGNIYNDCDTLMAPNFRPPQTNGNTVYHCQES